MPSSDKTLEDRCRQERELGGPYAGRDANDQRAAQQLDRLCPFGDARSDSGLPVFHRDGLGAPRETVVVRTTEDPAERLGRAEHRAAVATGHGRSLADRGREIVALTPAC
jgi:hypothetical protein